MLISSSDETDLLTALHMGQRESPLWSTFLGRLARRVRADAVVLHMARAGQHLPTPSHLRLPTARLPSLPGFQPDRWARLRPQRIYAGPELVEIGVIDPPAEPSPELRAVRLPAGELDALLLAVRDAGAFSGSEVSLLGALAPHAIIALANHADLARERRRAQAAARAGERHHIGWVILNRHGILIDRDPIADRLLRETAALHLSVHGRLLAATPRFARSLEEALAALADDPSHAPITLRLGATPAVDLLLTALPAPGDEHLLVAYLQPGGTPMLDPSVAGPFGVLHGLAPREARLAIALTNGGGIGAASEALGLSVETARNYSKSIYSKSGASGQADLARIVTGSVARLA